MIVQGGALGPKAGLELKREDSSASLEWGFPLRAEGCKLEPILARSDLLRLATNQTAAGLGVEDEDRL